MSGLTNQDLLKAQAFYDNLLYRGYKVRPCHFNTPNEILQLQEPHIIGSSEGKQTLPQKVFTYPFIIFDMPLKQTGSSDRLVLISCYQSIEECQANINLIRASESFNFVKVFDNKTNQDISDDLCMGMNTTPRPIPKRASLFS